MVVVDMGVDHDVDIFGMHADAGEAVQEVGVQVVERRRVRTLTVVSSGIQWCGAMSSVHRWLGCRGTSPRRSSPDPPIPGPARPRQNLLRVIIVRLPQSNEQSQRAYVRASGALDAQRRTDEREFLVSTHISRFIASISLIRFSVSRQQVASTYTVIDTTWVIGSFPAPGYPES